MKCPKCGYNSFECLDACKKCGSEFGSFKKSNRINPVMFSSGGASSPADAASSSDSTWGAPPPPAEPLVSDTDQEFSWEAPEPASSPAPSESAYEGFNFDFSDTSQTETNEMEFTGFSFEEPEADTTPSMTETPAEEFFFETPASEELQSPVWDTQPDDRGTEIEKYERMLDLDTIAETEDSFDWGKDGGEQDSFGTRDFQFTPEQATEDIFQQAESPVKAVPSAKGGQPEMADFDKEFEMIFAEDDNDETVKNGN